MMLKNYLRIDDKNLARFDELYRDYKRMYEDPDNCSPKFIIRTPVKLSSTVRERVEDPIAMLKAELDILRSHIEIGDDRVPSVRVQFGTAQVAAAFGCRMHVFENSLPAAGNHVVKSIEDIYKLRKPALDSGWYGKLKEFTEIFKENLPPGVHIQHPDIQSPFNNAYMIRGNDIFLDFYDDADAVGYLLDVVTDYMIELVPYLKNMISDDREWFFDWGAMWKGAARISNCSLHMISPEFYTKHILPRDKKLLKAIGGGRIHYCGTSDKVMDQMFKIDDLTGFDYDANHHNLWDICDKIPKNITLLQWGDPPEAQQSTVERLLKGDWPKKRNIIIEAQAGSIEEGRELLKRLRASVPD